MMTDPEILFEDEYLLVCNKPSGLVVNRSHTYSGVTLQDILEGRGFTGEDTDSRNEEEEGVETYQDDEDYPSEFDSRNGIVHRLDKDTSGTLIVAKDERTFKYLQKQFKKRHVNKEYYAVVFGIPESKKIEVDAPIGRNPGSPLKFAVNTDGKQARTKVEQIDHAYIDGQQLSLLKVSPKTGRTHQIRVHLAALGLPVVHDRLYDTKKQLEWSIEHFSRLMLHASSIEFMHPSSKKVLKVTSKFPEDFALLFKQSLPDRI